MINLQDKIYGLEDNHDFDKNLNYKSYLRIHQKSKVEGSGFNTFRLFLNINSANVSTGSFGNECKSSAIPSERIGTRLTSKYFLKARDFLSKISRY